MKNIVVLLLLSVCLHGQTQNPKPETLRSILLDQLRTTHNAKDWFVDANTAVAGLTPEQASWKQGGKHSVGQLAYHLVFWNERELAKFRGQKPAEFSGNNEETFDKFDAQQWAAIVQRLDQVMTNIEKVVETADEKQLQMWAPEIARIGTHNAYHIGQMVFVRKLQGSWDPAKGIK
jgi:phage-related protein